ncbi:molybdopterin molybdenumtransferase MoeA [Candidatus Bathyarchaeota archaeon ex4484_135]|nr:MAG: molybdopterin molybdenumtransferase MoeA [Candidatus Bathyarchaeota archaeon ex4484_135]
MGLQEALEAIINTLEPRPLGTEEVRLEEALGRVLAEDVEAPIDVPGFRRALMDGYAVRAQDTFGASVEEPARLKLVGRVEMGQAATVSVGPGECVEVSTGSMLPEGADAVVRLEDTVLHGQDVLVFEPAVPGQNVMEAGVDIKAGELVLRAGDFLTPQKLGVVSALGLRTVRVFRRPRVAVISTGVELVRPGEPLGPGKIYDINWLTVQLAVKAAGGEPFFLGTARDDSAELADLMAEGLEKADLVVATGASSVGSSDVVRDALSRLGAQVVVDGIRVKPGKPTVVAKAGGKPIFCLPGHPTSALITFTVFVEPVLARMSGLKGLTRPVLRARLASRIIPDTGRHNFVPVSLSKGPDGSLLARPVLKGSGAITSLSHADGYIEVPEGTEFLPEGTEVEVKLFWPPWPIGRSDIEAHVGR